MNEWLSTVYGTNSQDDLEKIAQAQVAQELAGQEGMDLSGLNESQIAALGQEVLGGDHGGAPQGMAPQHPGAEGGGMDPSQIDPEQITPEVMAQVEQILSAPDQHDPAHVQEAQAIMQVIEHHQAQQAGGQPQPGAPEMAKTAQERMVEAQEKFEEADFLGRVMAHSFNQEVEKIAASKQAAEYGADEKSEHQRIARGHGRMGALSGAVGGGIAGGMAHGPLGAVGGAALGGAIGYGSNYLGARVGNRISRAVGGEGSHSKEASAVNAAAEKLAAEILQANGIDPATLQPVAPAAAPQAAPDAQAAVNEIVEKRAHQILSQLGFKVE